MRSRGWRSSTLPPQPPQSLSPAATLAVHIRFIGRRARDHPRPRGRRRCIHRLDGECFIPREWSPLSTTRFLDRQKNHGAGVGPDRSVRVRGAAGARDCSNGEEEALQGEASTASVGILAWHPSPRAGDTRRGILASLLRDCNLGGSWNRWDGNLGSGTAGTGTQLSLLYTGALHSQREGQPCSLPGPQFTMRVVVKCRGGLSCEGQAWPLGPASARPRRPCSGRSGTFENSREGHELDENSREDRE